MSGAIRAIVEQGYSLEGDGGAWLAAIVRAAAAALERGVVGNLVERKSDGSLASVHVALHGVSAEWHATLRRTAMRMRTEELERRFTTAVTTERGVLAVSARADDRTAVLLDVPLDGTIDVALETWREVATHLASGLRMRAQLAPVDFDDAVSVWDALLEGRLAVTDRFDRDGRRFVVVRTTEAHDRAALTVRERQVLGSVVRGHSNKRIALDLGVSESTVSTALRGAARKLGVRSRVELARILGPPRKA